jgi:hypothetical protein
MLESTDRTFFPPGLANAFRGGFTVRPGQRVWCMFQPAWAMSQPASATHAPLALSPAGAIQEV